MPKLKLTDADRVILASAAARETGLVLPVPKSLKLSAADLEPVLRKLLSKGVLLERPSLPDEKPWTGAELSRVRLPSVPVVPVERVREAEFERLMAEARSCGGPSDCEPNSD